MERKTITAKATPAITISQVLLKMSSFKFGGMLYLPMKFEFVPMLTSGKITNTTNIISRFFGWNIRSELLKANIEICFKLVCLRWRAHSKTKIDALMSTSAMYAIAINSTIIKIIVSGLNRNWMRFSPVSRLKPVSCIENLNSINRSGEITLVDIILNKSSKNIRGRALNKSSEKRIPIESFRFLKNFFILFSFYHKTKLVFLLSQCVRIVLLFYEWIRLKKEVVDFVERFTLRVGFAKRLRRNSRNNSLFFDIVSNNTSNSGEGAIGHRNAC